MTLTARGWWLIILLLGLLTSGAVSGAVSLILVALTVLSWFFAQWILFQFRLRRAHGRWRLSRVLEDQAGVPMRTLWPGKSATVRIALSCDARVSFPFVWVTDRVPSLGLVVNNPPFTQGRIAPATPLEWSYDIEARTFGPLRFEGVKVTVTDLQGFFVASWFQRVEQTVRVLPRLFASRGGLPSLKRDNTLPIVGTHRHRRAGSSSELLDLRDYLPGDPPKRIAWKASARREKLMTKEFESEVPIRCTLFVDISSSVRVGPVGATPLTRLLEIAAGVYEACGEIRDLTGLCLFDDKNIRKLIRPARGNRHQLALTHALVECADLPVETTRTPVAQLLPWAYGVAQELYPECLESEVNGFPFWLAWWAPQPAYTMPLPRLKANRWWQVPGVWMWQKFRDIKSRLWHSIMGRVWGPRRRQSRWRKKVSALLSVKYGLDPGGLAWLSEDDRACSKYLQRFLAEHQVSPPTPILDDQGRYIHQQPEKAPVLAKALLASVARGRDDELFVLLVDLLGIESLEPLQRAVGIAMGRHHQVVLICPWPHEAPLPGQEPTEAPTTLQGLLAQAASIKMQQHYERVRQAFSKLGVPVILAPDDQATPLILHRLNRLRQTARGVR